MKSIAIFFSLGPLILSVPIFMVFGLGSAIVAIWDLNLLGRPLSKSRLAP